MKRTLLFLIGLFLFFSSSSYGNNWQILSKKLQSKSKTAVSIQGKKRPQMITGKYGYAQNLTKEEVAKRFIQDVHSTKAMPKRQYRLVIPDSKNLKIKKVFKDKLKENTIVRISQMLNGIPVFGSDIAIHINKSNEVEIACGRVHSLEAINTTPKLTKTNAWQILKDDIPTKNAELKSTELKIYYKDDIPFLTWHVVATVKKPTEEWHYFIEAQKGKIVSKFNNIKSLSGKSWDTYIYRPYSDSEPILALQNNQVTTNSNLQTLHNNISITYDYFLNTFNRISFDDQAALIKTIFYDDYNYVNAFWNGQYLVFGDGDGQNYSYFGNSLDIVAHEFGHAVTDYTADLIYQNQSGALNESMSDVWGAMVDRDDWIMGEVSIYPNDLNEGMRYFDDPTRGSQPAHMDDYENITYDNGGVHINSGIPNKAFYLIATQTGKDDAENIYYRALTHYFTQSTDFFGARLCLIQAAKDLFGETSRQASIVMQAFDDVGIISGPNDTETNDFEGIFVSSPFSTPHPYDNSQTYTQPYTHPGATAMKIRFDNFNTELNYDYVYIIDGTGKTIQTYCGSLGDFESAPVEGDTIIVQLRTDSSLTRYGFDIPGYLYLPAESDATEDATIQNYWATKNYSTQHPYEPSKKTIKEFIIPEAKSLQVRFLNFDTENECDKVILKDKNGIIVAEYSGNKSNFLSDRVMGDRVTLEFNSDAFENKYGFDISGLHYTKTTPVEIGTIAINDKSLTNGSIVTGNIDLDIPFNYFYQENIPSITFNIQVKNSDTGDIVYEQPFSGILGTTLSIPNINLESNKSYYLDIDLTQAWGQSKTISSKFFFLSTPGNDYSIPTYYHNISFSTEHPYSPNSTYSKTINIPDAKSLHIIFHNLNTDSSQDIVRIINKEGEVFQEYSGQKYSFMTKAINSNEVTIEFTSDAINSDYGFDIEGVYYNKELPMTLSSILLNDQNVLTTDELVTSGDLRLGVNLAYTDNSIKPTVTINMQIKRLPDAQIVYSEVKSGTEAKDFVFTPQLSPNKSYIAVARLDQSFGLSIHRSKSFTFLAPPTNSMSVEEAFTRIDNDIPVSSIDDQTIYRIIQKGAKSIRAQFSNLVTDPDSKIFLTNKWGDVVAEYSGNLGGFLSEPVLGDELIIKYQTPEDPSKIQFKLAGCYSSSQIPVDIAAILFNNKEINNNDYIKSNPEIELLLKYNDTKNIPQIYLNIQIKDLSTGQCVFNDYKTGFLGSTVVVVPKVFLDDTRYQVEAILEQDIGRIRVLSPPFKTTNQLTIEGLLNGPNPFN
ncbi:M4 family metallopeptidase, partial [Candidatus Margulisiibacteriota bacterium]